LTAQDAGGAAKLGLPAGTVTFLLSDVEGSTRLWSEFPEAMPAAVAQVYAILDEAVAAHDGVRPMEQGEGDSVVAAFSRASDALAAALQAQRVLHIRPWPDEMELGVRIALHTAEAQLRDEGTISGSRSRGVPVSVRLLLVARRFYRTRPATSSPIASPMASSSPIAANIACATSVARSASLRLCTRSFPRLSPHSWPRWAQSRPTSRASCRASWVASTSWRN
jgi:hypothetical protein